MAKAQLIPGLRGWKAGYFPYLAYDSFTRGNGAIGNTEASGPLGKAPVRAWTGATWTISTNKVINTPVPGLELVTNGNFANWTGDNPDGWNVGAETGGHFVTEVAGKCRYVCDAGQAFIVLQNIIANKKWYTASVNLTAVVAGYLNFQANVGAFYSGGLTTTGIKLFAGRSAGTQFRFWSETVAADVTIDDVSVKELALAELFSTVNLGKADVDLSVAITSAGQMQHVGLVLNLDSTSNPQNFVICYLSKEGGGGDFLVLTKCVGGNYTEVYKTAFVYGAGRILRVWKSGSTYTIYYHGAAIGIPQTISDVGIISNTLHGMFNTHVNNSLDTFTAVNV